MRRTRSRERRYRQLVQQLPQGVLVLSRGRIRLANRAAVHLFGAASASQLKGRLYDDFVMTVSATPHSGTEHHKLCRLDGQIIEVAAAFKGPTNARRVVLDDLARFVSSENALRRSEERLHLMSESVKDRAIVTVDAVGYVVHWNEVAERITGFSSDRIIGRPFSTLFTEDQIDNQQHEVLLRNAIETGRSEEEGWKRRADGSHYFAHTSVMALFDREQKVNGFAVMIRDLTTGGAADAMQNEGQLRQGQRMEAVGRLASGIAHDFNNLLTAINGHAQFLIEDLPDDDPSRADAEEILQSAERAATLTRQLLAFSSGQVMQPQTIDINQVVTSIERLLRRVISENINLSTNLDPMLWPVRADSSQIEQILVNLVVNARDAMADGGTIVIKTDNAELAESYSQKREEVQPGRYAMIAVSDSGAGMDAETQEHIFEPFFTTKESGKGTGLGLSTVYGIVKQSGGHIFVYSEPGRGTTFKIYLPCIAEATHSRMNGNTPEQRARSGETVLVIEDDTAVRALAKRVLEARGYDVLTAGSGEEALQVISSRRERIDLIVTDLVLPDTSGKLLMDAIEKRMPEVRTLLMSGYTAEDVQRQGGMSNGAGFIEKPFTPDAFAKKVRDALDASH